MAKELWDNANPIYFFTIPSIWRLACVKNTFARTFFFFFFFFFFFARFTCTSPTPLYTGVLAPCSRMAGECVGVGEQRIQQT
jgi:hypothetical protein